MLVFSILFLIYLSVNILTVVNADTENEDLCTDQFAALKTAAETNFENLKKNLDIERSTENKCKKLLQEGFCYSHASLFKAHCSINYHKLIEDEHLKDAEQYMPSMRDLCSSIETYIAESGEEDRLRKFFDDPSQPYVEDDTPTLSAFELSAASVLTWSSLKGMVRKYMTADVKNILVVAQLKYLLPTLEQAYVIYSEKGLRYTKKFSYEKLISAMFCDNFDIRANQDSSSAIKEYPDKFAEEVMSTLPWTSIYLKNTILKLPEKTTLDGALDEVFTFLEEFSKQSSFGRFSRRLGPVFLNIYANGCLGNFFVKLREMYYNELHCPVYKNEAKYPFYKDSLGCITSSVADIEMENQDMLEIVKKEVKDMKTCQEFIDKYTCFKTKFSQLAMIHCPQTWFIKCSATSITYYRESIVDFDSKHAYKKEAEKTKHICCHGRRMCAATKIPDNFQVNLALDDKEDQKEVEEKIVAKPPPKQSSEPIIFQKAGQPTQHILIKRQAFKLPDDVLKFIEDARSKPFFFDKDLDVDINYQQSSNQMKKA